MKKSKLKSEYARQLLESGIEPYSAVRHSYTNNRLKGEIDRVQNTNRDLSPTLDTRCDCLGVVVEIPMETKRFKNYITWKNKQGEFNTECNRASLENDLALTIATMDQTKVAVAMGGEQDMKVLRIRKLTPKECLRLQGFTDEDYQHLVEFGASASQIYHMAGDSITTTCIVGLISTISGDTDKHIKIINSYVDNHIIERTRL